MRPQRNKRDGADNLDPPSAKKRKLIPDTDSPDRKEPITHYFTLKGKNDMKLEISGKLSLYHEEGSTKWYEFLPINRIPPNRARIPPYWIRGEPAEGSPERYKLRVSKTTRETIYPPLGDGEEPRPPQDSQTGKDTPKSTSKSNGKPEYFPTLRLYGTLDFIKKEEEQTGNVEIYLYKPISGMLAQENYKFEIRPLSKHGFQVYTELLSEEKRDKRRKY